MVSNSEGACVVVAIDGPSAAGKSTAARGVARALGYIYVDSGAMYRTLAWYCLQHGTDLKRPAAIGATCRRWKARLHLVEGEPPEVVLIVNGYRPTRELRSREVAVAASDVAVVPAVRRWMRRTQRDCRQFGSLVMEGRDIATHVFPETSFKFWLDASVEERARRRRGEGVDENLAYRDRQDSQRAAAPLMPGLGATRMETTHRGPETVIAEIVTAVRAGTGSTCRPRPT